MEIPNSHVPPTAKTNMKTAAITAGNTASPLVFKACPTTRFVTRPISSTMSIASSLRTSAVISGLSVKSGIIKPEPSTIAVSMQTATHTPTNAARFVPLSHSSSSPAPMCQPVMIAFACASAAPTQ